MSRKLIDLTRAPIPLLMQRAANLEWNPLTEASDEIGTASHIAERTTADERSSAVERLYRIRQTQRRAA